MKRYFTILLLLLLAADSFAADLRPYTDRRLSFKYLSVNNGLSQNSVTSVVQGDDGLIYIATYDGLNIFDGYAIRVERHSPDHPQRLANNRIVTMEKMRDGSIMLGLDGGLVRYDPAEDKYTDYSDRLGIKGLRKVRALCEDSTGQLWIGHENGMLVATAKDGGYVFGSIAGFGAHEVFDIAEDRDGKVWIATADGVFVTHAGVADAAFAERVALPGDISARSIECDSWGCVWIGHTEGLLFSSGDGFSHVNVPGAGRLTTVNTLRDKQDHIWLGMGLNGGLYSLTIDDAGQVISHEHYSTGDLFGRLNDNAISSLFVDRSGVLWAGTHRGVNYAPTATPDFYTFKPLLGDRLTELGYDGKHINSLFIDSRDNLWISTFKGGGIYRYDLRLKRLTNISHQLTASSVSRVIESPAGVFWVAAQEGVYRVEETAPGKLQKSVLRLSDIPEEASKRYQYFLDLCEDSFGNIWIATEEGLICYRPDTGVSVRYTRKDGLSSSSIYCLLSDRENNAVWAGTADNGLTRIGYDQHGGLKQVDTFTHDNSSPGLDNGHIWSLLKARDGTIWIGTDAGLHKMELGGGSIARVTVPMLADAKILAITEDLRGDLWLNSSQGLYGYSPASGQVRRYVSDDGLQSNTWTEGAAISDNGWIFVGGINGINYFNPELFDSNGYAGRPILTGLKVHDHEVRTGQQYDGRVLLDRGINASDGIDLRYHQNNISIGFASDRYASPAKNLFRYRLEGYDREWVESAPSQHLVSYSRLPAGKYTFMLQLADGSGQWNDVVKRLDVNIRPAPWNTWWAYVVYTLLLCGAVVAAISYVISRQRWKRKLFVHKVEQDKTREMTEMKLNFYTNITHELRTPLSLITGPLKDIEEYGNTDGFIKLRLGLIGRNVDKLLRLINRILEIRKISAQDLPLKIVRHNVTNVVREIVHSFVSMSEQNGTVMNFESRETVDDAWFDREKIEQVLQNLISNAYKFTPANGTIKVTLDTALRDGVRYAVVSVEDIGVGIDEKDIDNIFDLFFHGTPLTGSSSGIGLSLSKAIMDAHSGTIDVVSEPGKGSVFTISFPIDRAFYLGMEAELQRETKEAPVPVAAKEHKHLVLIVEDNDDMREYIVECLKEDFRLATAADGEEGLTVAQKLRPDVVISDIMMPVMDGIEFVRRMKSNPRTNFIPIIIHSVKEDKASIREALTAGAHEYIIKPFDSENLIVRIRNLLNSREHFALKLKAENIIEPTSVDIPSDDAVLLEHLTKIVEANMQNPMFDIELLANQLHMSRMQLYRRMQRIAGGKTVSEVIRDIRIKRAAQLLSTGSKRISEVMYEVGINNQYRFTKYFQEAYKMSPKEYIQLHAPNKTNL